MYIAKNNDDVRKYIDMITSGNDVKKEECIKITNMLRTKYDNSIGCIANFLLSK